jgi:hypothetical protein
MAVQVIRVQAQTEVPTRNASASLVSDHLRCIAYYAIMSTCVSRFSQEDETRYFNAAAHFLTRARELGALYGQAPQAQEARVRELFSMMEHGVGSSCENVRKLDDLRPLQDQYNGFCKAVGQSAPHESSTPDVDLSFSGEHGVTTTAGEAPVQVGTIQSADPQPVGTSRVGWMIQLGAFADEAEAEQRLRSAQSMAQNLLGEADGFTERIIRGSKDLYRVRFGGFDKEKARAACHYFKRNEIECIVLKH